MSYLVLHMDKFKKEAVRGIQSHNHLERESHSNPDIDYQRSRDNYELHDRAATNYAQAIQRRIDDLQLIKAVRKDAVHMCGLIVTSDSAFFKSLSPEETRRFFEESKAFLTDFVGAENVISAMVHMDEKTPHMHFLHVPVTREGHLNANKIYTRQSLKKLQSDLPLHLQRCGFTIQRGVEQKPGAARKHLDTREYKQQQEANNRLAREGLLLVRDALRTIGRLGQREAELKQRVADYERQAEEAESLLREEEPLPEASLFNYRRVLGMSAQTISRLRKALSAKHLIARQKNELQREAAFLKKQLAQLEALCKAREQEKADMESRQARMGQELETYREFVREPEIRQRLTAFLREQQTAEQQRQAEERQRAAIAEREQPRTLRMR